jgi:hypothetical protein
MRRLNVLVFVLVIAMMCGTFITRVGAVSESDSLGLVALYNSTDGDNWADNTNWLSGPVSTWYGVTVSGDRVINLLLDFNNLVGVIPPEIGDLTQLVNLYLSANHLSGSIPSEIGNFTELTHLSLGWCYCYERQLRYAGCANSLLSVPELSKSFQS